MKKVNYQLECPECGSVVELVYSQNKEPFFSCITYPSCDGIIKILEEFRNLSSIELLDLTEEEVYL